jgi:predicted TIM-barrel fold metal-dependent hydrolase
MIIDTETHVLVRVWPVESDPSRSLIERYTWHEHSGHLLIAEMDRAGVDQAFVIGYDGHDFGFFMERHGGGADDYWGGRTYAYRFCKEYPDRFHWVPTLRDPRIHDGVGFLETERAKGAIGIKVLPSYIGLMLNDPALVDVFRRCRDSGMLVIIGLEDTRPPETVSLSAYFGQLKGVIDDLPGLRVQLNHGANVDLDQPEADDLFAFVREYPTVHVSTSVLGGVLMEWADAWEYPFEIYLSRLERYAREVPAEQLLWATDWPWYAHHAMYPQMLDAVRRHAKFFGTEELAAYLGGNAERLLRELGSATLVS